jgi:hypothetical protein
MDRKGQTTVVLIFLVLIIFAGLIVLLLSFATGIGSQEYMNLYTHNTLLSVMRTDTGFLNPNCRQISDTLACYFGAYGAENMCGSGQTCEQVANNRITEYLTTLEDVRQNYRYVFIVKSGSSDWTPLGPGGTPLELRIASTPEDSYLDEERVEKLVANERIQAGSRSISVQLIMAKIRE